MTIKQHGGIFGRNPTFNNVEANSLGIGTAAPSSVDLEINASVPRFQLTDADNSAYTQFLFNTGSFAVDVDPTEAGGSSKFTIDVDNVRHFELNSSGNLILETGNLVIGTSGKGIDFSATSDGSGTTTSELFNDYEEGDAQVTASPSTSGTITLTTNDDIGYVKVGKTVNITGDIRVSSVSSPVGNEISISSLPFTVDASAFSRAAVCVKYYDASTATWSVLPASVAPATTSITVVTDASTIEPNDRFYIGFTYQAA